MKRTLDVNIERSGMTLDTAMSLLEANVRGLKGKNNLITFGRLKELGLTAATVTLTELFSRLPGMSIGVFKISKNTSPQFDGPKSPVDNSIFSGTLIAISGEDASAQFIFVNEKYMCTCFYNKFVTPVLSNWVIKNNIDIDVIPPTTMTSIYNGLLSNFKDIDQVYISRTTAANCTDHPQQDIGGFLKSQKIINTDYLQTFHENGENVRIWRRQLSGETVRPWKLISAM